VAAQRPQDGSARLPRIAPMTYEMASEPVREFWDARGQRSDPRSDVIFGTFLCNLPATRVHFPLMGYVKTSECLPPRMRELAVLRTAWLCGADYMWEMHVEIALEVGITEEEVRRVASGVDGAWTADEASVLRAMDELHEVSRLSDETWVQLAGVFDDAQMVELLILAGAYHSMAFVMGSVGLRPPSGWSPDLPGNRFLFVDPQAEAAEIRSSS
jgi:alkylhydroperoxidase family enzyme